MNRAPRISRRSFIITSAVASVLAAASTVGSNQLLSEHRAARAVLYLRRGIAMGANPGALAQAPAFAALQSRRDFQQLVGSSTAGVLR